MPRFFLHIKDGATLIRDEEGIDVPSAAHARAEALPQRANCGPTPSKPGDIGADAFVIAGQDGKQLTFVSLAEVMPRRLRP
jgi:hypothetical protein